MVSDDDYVEIFGRRITFRQAIEASVLIHRLARSATDETGVVRFADFSLDANLVDVFTDMALYFFGQNARQDEGQGEWDPQWDMRR